MIKVVAFTQGRVDPATRYRFEQLISPLKSHGINLRLVNSVPPKFSSPKTKNQTANILLFGFWTWLKYVTRLLQVVLVLGADVVVIQRELVPYNIFYPEKLFRLFAKKLIFDFDDAIFHRENANKYLEKLISRRNRISDTCKIADVVVVGNEYLAEYARKFNRNVVVIPTVIDTDIYTPKTRPTTERYTIGWMGTSGNHKYLESISEPLLGFISKNKKSRLMIVSDSCPKFLSAWPRGNFIFKKWTPVSEIDDLRSFDVGLMPLSDDVWTRGKCGFKIIQYMAVEKPVVASAVGANNSIIESGKNGYLVSGSLGWIESLNTLRNDEGLSLAIGAEARKTAEERYSINSVIELYKKIYS